MTGRKPHRNRPSIFRDLANLNLTIAEIAERNEVSPRLVHSVGRQNDLNMRLRGQIVRTMKVLWAMEKTLRRQREEFLSKFPEEFRTRRWDQGQ